jgi:hypothetical protein
MTNTSIQTINKGDKFVGMWGYDQTQYSIYNVVDIKGKFVLVEGLNSWSRLDENDLAATSIVKLYKQNRWEELSEEERADWMSRGFDPHGYERFQREEAIKNAPELTIVKAGRINKDKYSYRWELSNGEVLESTEDWKTRKRVEIVHGVTRRLVQESRWNPGQFHIKIDQTITASLDPEFNRNEDKYVEQNEYTSYHGR